MLQYSEHEDVPSIGSVGIVDAGADDLTKDG